MFFFRDFFQIERKRDLFLRPVMRQLFLPLALMSVFLFALVSLLFWQQYRNHLNQRLWGLQSSLMEELQVDLENQAFGLKLALLVFAEDPRLARTLEEASPERFAEWIPLVEEIRKNYGIGHLLFLGPRGTSLFRAPGSVRWGDQVRHPVMLEAERSRQTAWGMDLTPGGVFALLAVQPVFSGDHLVGYVEMGKPMEDILEKRHEQRGVLMAVTIEKRHLFRSLWENVMRSLDREARWNRLSQSVVTYTSRKDLPDSFFALLNSHLLNTPKEKNQGFFFREKPWRLMTSPLKGASGEEVGSLVVLWDISREREGFLKNLLLGGVAGGILLLLIMGGIIFFLGRTDAKILSQQKALEESEERFRLLADDLPALVCEFAHDSRLLFVNKAYGECFDMTSEELLERHFLDFVPPEERAAVERGYRSFTRKEPLVINVHRVMSKNGIRWQEWRDRPLFNEHGRLVGYRAIGVDITERKEMQEALQKTNRSLQEAILQAQRANMAKSEFLANMSHEIRTPLHAVLGMAELLAETELQEEQRHYLHMLMTSSETLLSLIEDMLDFAKIEAGKVELRIQDFHLSELLEALVAPLAVQAREKNVALTCRIGENVPTLLRGDPGRLRQILTNLLGNAVKFTPRGEVVLQVSREPSANSGESSPVIRFSVRDTGIGIPEEKMSSLFKRFSQLDSSTTRQYRGTGLGLAISKRLVELMQGTLGVRSREGEGSEFWFTVPLEMPRSGVPAETDR